MPKAVRYIIIIAILALIAGRFFKIDLDPPYFYKGYSTDHLTDPYHLTYFARNAVLYDDWDPFDWHRWDIFKYSAVSAASYVFFSIFGVSKAVANLTGILLTLGGLLFFLLGMRKTRPISEVLIAGLLVSLSSTLFFYGRMPFLETGVIFLSGLCFYVLMRFGDKWYGLLGTGILIALAALAGKLFAFMLVVPAGGYLIFKDGRESIKSISLMLAGLAAGIGLYVLLFFGGSLSVMKEYYLEQTFGMYGPPQGFDSIKAFFLKFVTYGTDSGFWDLSPFLVILGGIGTVLFILSLRKRREDLKPQLPLIFCTVWVLTGIMGLMPFNYRPLRYTIFLFPPLLYLGAYALDAMFEKRVALRWPDRIMTPLATTGIIWFLIIGSYLVFQPRLDKYIDGLAAMLPVLGIAVVITAGIWWLLRKSEREIRGWYLGTIPAILLICAIWYQGSLIYKGMSVPQYNLKDISREIGELLPADAVLTGPYAPVFTIDNDLKAVIYHFGLADIQADLLERFPITHSITDRPNWTRAVQDFPALSRSLGLADFVVRDFTVRLHRFPDTLRQMSPFEKAVAYRVQGKLDSAIFAMTDIAKAYPDNLTAKITLTQLLAQVGMITESAVLVDDLLREAPDNHRLWVFAGMHFTTLFQMSGNTDLGRKGEEYSEKALSLFTPDVR